ncbi:Transcription termination factor, mitochondrial/chloroplastic [Dillenia turbinata]|uniref:Transcription termination factor, mitochondrial/chloroplastic n=1 Tax=Dillenia turbinata TaxID=194707 RepID=A0AAN8USK5_9MAGN
MSAKILQILIPPSANHRSASTTTTRTLYLLRVQPFLDFRRKHLCLFHFHLPPRRNLSVSISALVSSNGVSEQFEEEAEAREAISQILQESGLSRKDSIQIASNSPKYVKMLVDSVRDLDESSLWNSFSQSEQGEEFCFRKKVCYMAKEKGDNGVVPFLESIGLTLSSSMRISRYLSSETLPALIRKVNYVKEMFFSGSDREVLIGTNSRRFMMHLSISVDEDLQQILSFFEKVEARRGGLNMLGSTDASFQYLLESFPRLLLLSIESQLEPLVKLLENIGVPRGRMKDVLLLFPLIAFYDITEIKQRLQALHQVGALDKDVGKIFLKYPWVLSKSILQNLNNILSFFELEKVPREDIERAIRSWPLLLGCSVSKLRLMVEHFSELGIQKRRLGQVIARSPQLLLRKPHEFLQVILFLEDLGFDKETVGKILGRCPEIFATNIEKTLKKKLQFLSDIGVSRKHYPRVIRKYPELFVSDTYGNLLPRIKYLRESGLSEKEIAFMIRKFSPLLGYSIQEVLKPKMEFLVNTMQRSTREVVDYPRYFSYSLEKKIIPRYWVLKGRNIECSLQEMLGKNDDEFAAEFMGVGRMFVPLSNNLQ